MITSTQTIDIRNRVKARLVGMGIEIETPIDTHVYQAAGIVIMHLRLRPESAQKMDAITARGDDIAVAAGVMPRMYVDAKTSSVVAEFQIAKPPTLYTSMLLAAGRPYCMTIGRDVGGQPLYIDISSAATPHILAAGTTGAGKTAMCHNAIATIARATPRLKIMAYDPAHPGFPWLMPHIKGNLIAAITDPQQLFVRLSQMVELIEQGRTVPGRVLVYIDEVRDLIQAEPRIVEPLTRIAQRGRQAGIHLLCATQNPSRKSLPPDLLVNLPARVVLAVADRAQSDMASGNQKIDAHKLSKPAGVLVADGAITRFVAAMPDGYAAMNDLDGAEQVADIRVSRPMPERVALQGMRDFGMPSPMLEIAAAAIDSPNGETVVQLAAPNFTLPARVQTIEPVTPAMPVERDAADYSLEARIRLVMAWNPAVSVSALLNALKPGGAQGGFHVVTEIVGRIRAEQSHGGE